MQNRSMVRWMFLLLFLSSSCIGVAAPPVIDTAHQRFEYFGQGKVKAEGFPKDAADIVELILDIVGVDAAMEIKKAFVPNAAAVVYHGKRYILYNPLFIAFLNKTAGTPWASITILAHEIGHHVNGHTLNGKGSQPRLELEADTFAGFVLRKLGASLADAQLAIKIVATTRATKTHPARKDRLRAIASGWYLADAERNGYIEIN